MEGITKIEKQDSEYFPMHGWMIFALYNGSDSTEILEYNFDSFEQALECLKDRYPAMLLVDATVMEVEKQRRRDAPFAVYDSFQYMPKGY